MRFRLTPAALALSALVAGLLVASPAEAASPSVTILGTTAGIAKNGSGNVLARCSAKTACSGTVSFDDGQLIKVRYKIPARSSRQIAIGVSSKSKYNPYTSPAAVAAGEAKRVASTRLIVAEGGPKRLDRVYTKLALETRIGTQQITGTVTASPGSGAVDNRVVRLFTRVRGGNKRQVGAADIGSDGRYSFDVALGQNNSSTAKFYLQIEGVDRDGSVRSWWWRGLDDTFYGGSRYERDAASVTPTRKDFIADFTYGTIKGTTGVANSDVSVASPPHAYYGSDTSAMRELDLERCANVFGHVRTGSSGAYQIDFLPTTTRVDNRYMVGARAGSLEVWSAGPVANNQGTRYGSCQDALDYRYSRANLLTLTPGSTAVLNVPLVAPTDRVVVDRKASGVSRTAADNYVRIRERIPGLAVMDAPVVAQGTGSSYYLQPGNYFLEVGRRTGCSTWLPSRYPNNRAYFNGLDRGAESWKTVSGKSPEYARSVAMGYKAKNPPRGYKGWMYRGYCGANSAGTVRTFNLTTERVDIGTVVRKGATVSGRVTRTGGRTNKEMMVRLSSSDGTRVLRTAITNGSGRFTVRGLASGRYTITVNSDSWRGISRSFSGKHSITVKAGRGYSAGTLRFKG